MIDNAVLLINATNGRKNIKKENQMQEQSSEESVCGTPQNHKRLELVPLHEKNTAIIEKMLEVENIDDVEIEDMGAIKAPQKISQWRKYLLKVSYERKKLKELKALRDSILESYDDEINKKEMSLNVFINFLKFSLLKNNDFKTKTGGFGVKIPDVGAFSASMQKITFTPSSERIKADPMFAVIKPPEFSKSKFNAHFKEGFENGKYMTSGSCTVKEIKSGKIIEGVEVECKRTWSIPE